MGWAKPWSFIENQHLRRNREWLGEAEDILKRNIFAFAEITLSLQRGFGIYGFRRRSWEQKWIWGAKLAFWAKFGKLDQH